MKRQRMLDRLPTDLSRYLISEYLQFELKHLTPVDVAFCSHKRRADWLTLLGQLKDVRVTTGQRLLWHIRTLNGLLEWVASRGVHVTDLKIAAQALTSGQLTISQPLLSVECLQITSGKCVNRPLIMAPLLRLLECLPRLKTLTVWNGIVDCELTTLIETMKDLEGIELSDCYHLNPDIVTSLVCSLGSQLRTLKCECSLTESNLTAIAENCCNLTTLHIACNCLPTFTSFEHLCAVNAKTLRTLSLGEWKACQDDVTQALLRITAMCSNLVSFKAARIATLDPIPIVQSLLSHCPLMSKIILNEQDVSIAVVKDKNGRRTTELRQSHVRDQASLLVAIPIPLRECFFKFSDVEAIAAILGTLAERFSSSLESLTMWFPATTAGGKQSSHLLNCLKRCRQLTELDINYDHSDCQEFMVPVLPLIPALCPHLTVLQIDINDMDAPQFVILLDGFRAMPDNAMKELAVSWTLADTELHSIAEVFPRLFTLCACHRNIDMPVLLDLIVSGQLKAKRIIVDHPYFKWLSENLNTHRVRHKIVRSSELWLAL